MSHFVDAPFRQCAIFVNAPFCQRAISSTRHFANVSFRQCAISPTKKQKHNKKGSFNQITTV
jgi:hypothetical protein